MGEFDYKEFWRLYGQEGIAQAIEYAKSFAVDEETYEQVIQQHVPGLIEEAKEQEINMIQFLADLDELEQKELDDAPGTDNDVGGISPDSGSEVSVDENEDVSAPTSDDDGEDRGED